VVAVIMYLALIATLGRANVTPADFAIAVAGVTIVIAAIMIAFGGITTGRVETRTTPNQATWQNVNFANRSKLLYATLLGLIGFPVAFVVPAQTAVVLVLYTLALDLPLVWFATGGGPLYHFLIRRVLEHDGLIPRNMAHFLDFCASLILMRKVGGS